MIGLAKHRANIGHLPHQPFEHFGAPRIPSGQKFSGLFRQMDKNCARLEDRDFFVFVHYRWNFAVRTNLYKLGFELLTLANIDRMNLILEPAFLEHDRDLPSVRRSPRVEINHLSLLLLAFKVFLTEFAAYR